VTPLWLHGSLISRHSPRPFAVWQWLKFLSTQQVAPHLRLVPARTSVVASSNYWQNLPDRLRSVMLPAFSNGRPVLIEEQSLFTWEQLAALVAGEMTPEEAARFRRVRWFDKGE
jgi:ABC-type glycerol-3-phosphate transport system substrate-binding protein